MPFLSISMLGSLDVTLDGKRVDGFEYNKVKALLAYLTIESERPHHREILAEILWPERPAQMARNSLRQALSILRNVINDRSADIPYLSISRDTVQFNKRSDYWLDVNVFVDSLNACRDNMRRNLDPAVTCTHWLKQAARLYRGDFMDQFLLNDSLQFMEWLNLKRDEYRREAIEVFSLLSSYYENQNEFEEARYFAKKQLDLDDTQEEGHRKLMRIYYQLGERNSALTQYESCQKILNEELGVQPEEETQNLYNRIRTMTEERPGEMKSSPVMISHPHNLPTESTPLIGRDKDVAYLIDQFHNTNCRLQTISGPGGVGKTRLSIRVGASMLNEFPDGVYIVSLAPLSSPDYIPSAIAEALNISFYGESSQVDQVFNYLRDKKMLIILDNFEHLLDGARLISDILEHSTEIRILTTSRERLNVVGECLFIPEGLKYPVEGGGENLESFSSVQLFVRTVKRLQPAFTLAENDRKRVGDICRLVEGFPLGIELAASWIRVLSLEEICDEIEKNLDFLETDARNMPERHRSLRAVFEHSWKYLNDQERSAFQKLTVFRGGIRRDAAEYVAGVSLPLLSSLANKSLLRRSPSGRFEIHEILRQYGALKLSENPTAAENADRAHFEFFMDFLRKKETVLKTNKQKETLVELELELANVRKAWDYAINQAPEVEQGAAAALWYFYDTRGWFQEGEDVFRAALNSLKRLGDNDSDPYSRKRLEGIYYNYTGWFCHRRGEFKEAHKYLDESLEIFESINARKEMADPLCTLGILAHINGELDRARSLLEKSLSIYIKNENNWGISHSLRNLGITEFKRGNYKEARTALTESIDICRLSGDRRGEAHTLDGLARLSRKLGDVDEARKQLSSSLIIKQELGDRWGSAISFGDLGDIAYQKEDYEEARSHFEKSLTLYRDVGDEWGVILVLNRLGHTCASMGEAKLARTHFLEALKRAWKVKVLSGAQEAMLALAAEGDLEYEDSYLTILLHHSMNLGPVTEELKEEASTLLEEVRERNNQEDFDKWIQKASEMNAHDVMEFVLKNHSESEDPES